MSARHRKRTRPARIRRAASTTPLARESASAPSRNRVRAELHAARLTADTSGFSPFRTPRDRATTAAFPARTSA